MTKKIVKSEKLPEMSEREICELAETGTRENIQKIEKFLKAEKDKDKKVLWQAALEECEFHYYMPISEKEEDEFYLLVQIRSRKQNIEKLEEEQLKLTDVTDQCALEAKIHSKVLAKNKDRWEEWEGKFNPEMLMEGLRSAEEINGDIAYEKAWIAEAKKSVTTPRYKNVPDRFIKSYDTVGDDECEDDCCGGSCEKHSNDKCC